MKWTGRPSGELRSECTALLRRSAFAALLRFSARPFAALDHRRTIRKQRGACGRMIGEADTETIGRLAARQVRAAQEFPGGAFARVVRAVHAAEICQGKEVGVLNRFFSSHRAENRRGHFRHFRMGGFPVFSFYTSGSARTVIYHRGVSDGRRFRACMTRSRVFLMVVVCGACTYA